MSYLQSLAILIVSMLFSLVARHSASKGEIAHVRGTLTCREQVALLPGSEATIELVDVSKAAGAGRTIATAVVRDVEQVPIAFEFAYDRNQLAPQALLAIRGRISNQGRDLYSMRAPMPIDEGAAQAVEVLLRDVSRA